MPHITAETASGTVEFDAEEDKSSSLRSRTRGLTYCTAAAAMRGALRAASS